MIEITSKIDFPTMKKFLLEIEQATKDVDYSNVTLYSKELERILREAQTVISSNDPYGEDLAKKWLKMSQQRDFFKKGYAPFRKGLRLRRISEDPLFNGKNENLCLNPIEIAVAYPTSICILLEQKKILFDSKLFTEFYKAIYLYRNELKQEVSSGLSEDRLYRLLRIILNSVFGLIYGNKYYFFRNKNKTSENITLLDPWNKLTLSVRDMLDYANVDRWIVLEDEPNSSEKRDQVEQLINAHGFKIA
jgi:hypothetical protein